MPATEASGRRQGDRAGCGRRRRSSAPVRRRARLRCGAHAPQHQPGGFPPPPPPAGPVQPRVQACELFYAWEKTHKPSLLDRAVADAYSSRVPWPFAPRFRADLSGLRNSTRKSAHSPAAISFEHAVQDNCKQIKADLTWRHRPAFRRAVAQFSRPSYCNGTVGGLQQAGCSRLNSWRGRNFGEIDGH